MYTWGYIKDCALSKLDFDSAEDVFVNGLLKRFPYYANEVITQVCSAIKPKYAFAEFEITSENDVRVMPDDFVSFGDYENYVEETEHNKTRLRVATDEDFVVYGSNQVLFFKPGKYRISYNARWYTFNSMMDDREEINVPNDILDCIPSYIASQCYKMDDEYKAQTYRNEYELSLARIDNTNYKNTKTLHIRGGW